jgi:hypothetical protein
MNILNFLKWAGCIALILTMQCSFASFGQEQSQAAKKSKQPEQLPTQRFDTVQLLDHARRLADDARSLKPVDEIPLHARLADIVWNFDQSFAERLLSRSFELTIASLKNSPRADSASDSVNPQLQFAQISSIAAKHDQKLEKKLNERWQMAVAEKGNELKSDPAQMANLLLHQATNYLKSDEQKARQLFRQSVALRVTQDHCYFLLGQRQHSSNLTDTLFSDTLEALAQRPLADANELLMLSSYLFSADGSVYYVLVSGYNTANVTGNMSAPPKNAPLAKSYLRLLLAKINANELTPPAVAHFALKNLVPQYQILAPELLDDVYAKMATLLPSVSKDDAALFEYGNKSSQASESETVAGWDKKIEKADKIEKDDLRDWEYYSILFGYLLPNNDFARALVMVGKISDQDLREKSSDVVNLAALQAKLDKPETASSVSESDLNKIKHPLARVVGLSALGQARMKQKATGDALRLFAEAAGEANHVKDDQDRLQARLMLVQLLVDADAATGFEKAVEAFKEINQFSGFRPNTTTLSLRARVYRFDQELTLPSPVPASFWSTVEKMCRANCEETFQTTGRLEKKEVRLWAIFMAVQTGMREISKQPNVSLH